MTTACARRLVILAALAVGPLAAGQNLSPNSAASSEPVFAAASDAFVESIGVATHFNYDDTKYYTEYEAVRDRLVELGVRYVRDAPSMPGSWKRPLVLDLYDETGIRLLAIVHERVGPYPAPLDLDPAATEAVIAGIEEHYSGGGRRAVVAIEGPNEYDLSHGPDPDWVARLRAYQEILYGAVRERPALDGVPVLAPTLVWPRSYTAVGDLSDVADRANVHPYPGGRRPTTGLDANLARAASVAPGDVWATETGYHNAMGDAADGTGDLTHPGVPEEVEARYLPRLFAEYFRRGVEKTFAYELLNVYPDGDNDSETANFGLLRNDLTPKPAFHALRRLIRLLSDPGPPFEPGTLRYSLGGDGVEHLLLQKRDGRFLVLLWRDISSYAVPGGWRSGEPGTVRDPAPVRVTLALDTPALSAVVHDPTASDEPMATWETPIAIEVDVRDRLVVVEVVPRVTQSIPLRVGWNLVSTWVAPSDSTTRSVLGDAAPNVLLVKDQNGRVFAPTYEIDDVPFWVKTQAYDVYATAPDTLSVEGRPVLETTPVQLEAGWNHVAFLGRGSLPIERALGSISDHVVLVRDGHGNAYAPSEGLRSLTTLRPGEGYQVNVSAPVVLRYPASDGGHD